MELGRNCRRYFPALLDFVDHGEIAQPDTGLALAHLDRCHRCTVELESTVLAITALRRLGAEAGEVEPAEDAWPRLRARLGRWRPVRWAILSPTAGMVMSVALVVVLIAPMRIGGASPSSAQAADPSTWNAVATNERRVETNFIVKAARHGTLPVAQVAIRRAETFPRIYPDNYRPERKEVSPAEPNGRPSEAI